jgi:hypothetical protein
VPGRVKADADVPERQGPAVRQRFDPRLGAEAAGQKRRRRPGAEIGGAARAGVIAVGVGDERAIDRLPWIDVKPSCRAEKPLPGFHQQHK